MLNKNDPLIGAVQEVMKRNQVERNAAKLVNEKFGVTDRKALPHEKQSAWDTEYKSVLNEALHPNQQKLDVHEPEKDKLTAQDFKMLRAKKKPMEEATDGDTTSPSSMGIKKPDYATGTPDYAKPKEQTVNRAAKTSLPPGTMKEEMTDAQMKKREKIVMSMKKKMAGFKERYGKRAKDVMYATATKQAMKEDNEGFNGRHGLSVTASAEKQAVADQLNEKVGLPLAARQAQQQAAKNAAITKSRLAREPKEAPSSIGSRIRQGLGATNAFVRRLGSGMGGDYVAAAGDYAAKNYIGKPLGLSKGTTWDKEYGQEVEKNKRSELNYPTATQLGDIAGLAVGPEGLAVGAAAKGLKYVPKIVNRFRNTAKGAEVAADATKAVPKLLSAPKTAKPVSQAAREPTDVDKFIAKAKEIPVTPSATAAGSNAAANAAKYTKSGTAGGRFTDKLAQAKKNAGSDPKARQLPALRGTTQPTVATRPNVPAVINKPSTALTRPGMPNLAAGGATRRVGLSPLGKATVAGGLGAAAIGTAAYMANKPGTDAKAQGPSPVAKPSGSTAQPYGMNVPKKLSPDSTVAKGNVPPVPKAKPTAPAVSKPPAAKAPAPAATPPVAKKVVPQANQPSASERRENRRLLDRGQVVGPEAKRAQQRSGTGVTTGTTIQQKPMKINRNLPGK